MIFGMRLNMFRFILCWFTFLVLKLQPVTAFGTREFVNLRFTQEPQDALVVRGQPVRFDCAYDVVQPLRNLVNVTWYHNDKPMLSLTYTASSRVYLLSNNSLYIAKTVQTDSEQPDIGAYHCVLRLASVGAARSRTATLSVAYVSSVFSQQPQDKEAAVNDTVVFHCEIDRLPRTQLEWYYSERAETLPYRLTDRLDGRFVLHRQGAHLEIHLTGANWQRAFGLYRCDAPVPGGRGFVRSRLAALTPSPENRRRPPLWFEATPPARVSARVDDPLTLVCAANDAEGSAQIDWLRGSAALRTSDRVHQVGQGSLHFASLLAADSGGYVCRARSGKSREIYTQTELTVLAPPEFLDTPTVGDALPGGAVTAFVGGAATLRCDTTGSPQPTIDWLKNGLPLAQKPPFVRRHGPELRLRGLVAGDSGLYQCLAGSSAGSVQRLTQLLVLESAAEADRSAPPPRMGARGHLPESPSNLRYYQLGTDFCQLEWRAPEAATGDSAWENFLIELLPEDSSRRLTFVTKETGYIISGLQADTAYTVRVSTQSSRGELRSRPAVMTFRTERAAPAPDPVTSLRILAVNSTDLRISWQPPASPADCLVVLLQLRDLTLQSDWQFNTTCSPPRQPVEGLRVRVRPHRRYRLLATVLSDFGQSRPAMLSLRTPSARPDSSPDNFTAVGVGAGAQLSWLPPPLSGRNGLLVGYRIRYRELAAETEVVGDEGVGAAVHKATVPGNQLTHRLAGLKPFSRYAVQVAGRTVNGTGRFTEWRVFNTQSGAYRYQSARLRDQTDAAQLSGDVPLPEKIRIRPKDVTAIGKRDSILLSWVRPSSVVVPDKYIIYYGSQLPKERLASEISGDQDAYQIRNLVPNQYYFITIVAIKDGVQAETPLHEKTHSEAHDRQSPSVPLNVKAAVVDGRTAVVSWTDRDLGLPGADSAGRFYEVELAEDASSSSGSSDSPTPVRQAKPRRFNTTGLRLRLSQLRPFTAYSARVRCHLGYMQSDYSLRAIFVTLAEPPGTPPLELRAARTSLPGSVLLSWRPPLEPNGPLTGYTVYYAPHGGRFASRSAAAKETQIVITGLLQSSLYVFKVRAENQAGAGPTTNLTAFMTPDSNGYGGGMVLDAIGGAGSQSDSPLQAAGPSDAESDRKLWFVIGGGFGLAIVLLIVAIATVCLCRSGEASASARSGSGGRRRRNADRAAKEEASLIGQEAAANQRHPGSPRARSGKNSPDAQAAALLISAGGQHQHQHQQQTPDLCRRSDNCLELRHLPQAGRSADGPVGGGGPFGRSSMHPHLGGGHHLALGCGRGGGGGGGFVGEPLLLDHPGGASPNPSGHFRNISSSGLYPPGTPPSYQPASVAAAIATSSRGLASPPRVDAPDFSSGKLSSPHSSLSSSIGSPSKRNPVTSAAAAAASASTAAPTLMLASLGNGRSVNVTPDILNPPVARPSRSLHGGSGGSGGGGSGGGGGGIGSGFNGSGAGGGGSTFDSQTSRSFVLSTEDMTKTLDGLMNDLRCLTNKEFEC